MHDGVTSGITVVEFGDSIATAYCGKLFADYGATVIKVELPGGDSMRSSAPIPEPASPDQHGGLFEFLNTSKQSVTIDWNTVDGAALVKRLAQGADLLVHSFDAEERDAIGFGTNEYPSALVEVAITPVGLDGPYAGQAHTPLTIAALGGWMNAMGDQDKPPLYPGGPYISYLAGTSAAIGALIALENRLNDDAGQLVEISEYETAVGVLPFDTLQFSYSGTVRTRTGELYSDNPLAAIYPCADGYVQFQVGFRPGEFLNWIGGPELENDPRFVNADSRSEHREELRTLILDWLKDKKRWDLFNEAGRRRLVFAAVPDAGEVLDLPPHQVRSFFTTASDGMYQGVQFPGPAIRFGDGAWRLDAAPEAGDHNLDVFTERLGLDSEDLTGLRERGVI